jgi:multidrug efflux pump subunit AcrA (membrane-fusion protein)
LPQAALFLKTAIPGEKKMSNTKFLFLLFCVLPLLLSGCGAGVEEEPPDKEGVVPVEVYTAGRGKLELALRYVGDIKGRSQIEVYPKVSGKLESYTVSEGDSVNEDGEIAVIDRDVTGYDFKPAPVEAPISGVVAKLFPDEGDLVSPQKPLAVVADVKEVVIKMSVGERDYPEVKPGQRARLRVDAYPEKRFNGKLAKLSRLIDPVTRSADAEVSVPNPDGLLIPGMFARVELITGEKDALLVIRDAVVRLPGTASYYCYLVEDGVIRRTRVRTGDSSGEHVEILSGLDEGDKVVISGHGILEDGMRVEIAESSQGEK